jgi:hypothetical protein
MRLALALPLTFIALAAAEAWWTWQSREYWSPVPGIAVASLVLVTACVAIWTLWSGRPFAPTAIALNGVCTLGMAVALPWLFPIVIATTEPPTLFERVRYPLGVVAIVVCSVVYVWGVGRTLRAAAH